MDDEVGVGGGVVDGWAVWLPLLEDRQLVSKKLIVNGALAPLMSYGDVSLLEITSLYRPGKGTMTFDQTQEVSPSATSGERGCWKLPSADWIETVKETGKIVLKVGKMDKPNLALWQV